MAEAVGQLSGLGFEFFDVNMGCPAHKIVGNGEGSALMKEPELAGRIVSAMAKATDKPVTVKYRRRLGTENSPKTRSRWRSAWRTAARR